MAIFIMNTPSKIIGRLAFTIPIYVYPFRESVVFEIERERKKTDFVIEISNYRRSLAY